MARKKKAKAPVVVKESWFDLTREEKRVALASIICAKVSEAYAMAGMGRSKFHEIKRRIKPVIEKAKDEIPMEALLILKAGSVLAARELVDELYSPDAMIRQKAANSILDRTLNNRDSQTQVNVGVQVNLADITNQLRRERGLDVSDAEHDRGSDQSSEK